MAVKGLIHAAYYIYIQFDFSVVSWTLHSTGYHVTCGSRSVVCVGVGGVGGNEDVTRSITISEVLNDFRVLKTVLFKGSLAYSSVLAYSFGFVGGSEVGCYM